MTAPAGPAKHGRIVVGVDGSTPSVAALRWAAAVAPALHADIEAWMVWSYPVTYGLAPLPGWDFAADAEKALQLTLDTAFGPERPATLTAHVKQGLAPHTLIEASRGADLLVVGNRGYGGFKGLLLGSVSTACVQHARCPVVVVRGAGHEPDGKADHKPTTKPTSAPRPVRLDHAWCGRSAGRNAGHRNPLVRPAVSRRTCLQVSQAS